MTEGSRVGVKSEGWGGADSDRLSDEAQSLAEREQGVVLPVPK